jgi:signal transduction histidine kinase
MNTVLTPLSMLKLNQLISTEILDDLVPAFERLFDLHHQVNVMDNEGQVVYGVSSEAYNRHAITPIIINDQEIGTLGLCGSSGSYDEALHFLAQSLAHIARETLRRRQHGDELIARYDELSVIYGLGTLISNKGLSQDEIVDAVLHESNRILRADAGVIYVYNDQLRDLHPVSYFGRDDRHFWLGHMRELAKSTLYAYENAQLYDNGKVICAPLRHGDELLGAVVLMSVETEKAFSANDVNLLTTLSNNTTLFIQAARLYERLELRKDELEQALGQLQVARDELSRSERLTIIGQTVGGLIHDMRNPLNIVMGYAGLLQEGGLTEDESHEYATQIIRYVDTFSAMAQEILDYTQSDQKIHQRPIEVVDYMEHIRALLLPPGLKRSVQILVNAEKASGYTICVDTQRFGRVFQNLVNNAVDAIEEHGGSQVEVTAEPTSDHMIRFTVADDGPGIPQELVSTIFEPFVTNKAHGTGLGLAIVDRMVTIHGGTIRYERGANGGATFVFTVPLC